MPPCPHDIDLFVVEPLPFEPAYARAVQVSLGPVATRVAAIPDLIRLIELRHVPAIKPLTGLFLDAPLGDHHDNLAGRVFPQAFCSWIGGSELPEAKAAVQQYDRFFDAPGAWQARCHDILGLP
jgi:hypothetical protein